MLPSGDQIICSQMPAVLGGPGSLCLFFPADVAATLLPYRTWQLLSIALACSQYFQICALGKPQPEGKI